MSLDVYYYSFSPSRADKNWPNFVDDIFRLQQDYAKSGAAVDYSDYRKRADAIEAKFSPQISEIRQKIFKYFADRGYMIPWIEWDQTEGVNKKGNPMAMTDDEKMEYLCVYGCVYRPGTDFSKKNNDYLMLNTAAPELQAEYEKIIAAQNQELKKLDNEIFGSEQKILESGISCRQENMKAEGLGDYFLDEKKISNSRLLAELKRIDIFYGSVKNEYFENPKLEEKCLAAIVKSADLPTDGLVATKDSWIRLFGNLNQIIIKKAVADLMKAADIEEPEAQTEIVSYLQSIRSVVLDLKKVPDSIFIRRYGGEDFVEPAAADKFLEKRARQHTLDYKGKLPPYL